MALFELALAKTLVYEGGYINDPDDSGGETNFGISKRQYPNLAIKNLTRAKASVIYRQDYWFPLYDQIKSQDIADELFDFGVNAGVKTAVMALQRALKRIVAGPIVIDGKFGPRTLEMVNSADVERLLLRFHIQMAIHYAKSAVHDPHKEKFLTNWMTRALEV